MRNQRLIFIIWFKILPCVRVCQCLVCILLMKLNRMHLQPGEILEVVSDCPQSINNIPLDAKNHGYEVLSVQQDGPTIRYLIRR